MRYGGKAWITSARRSMHLAQPWGFARHWLEARNKGQSEAGARWALSLQVSGAVVFAGPNTEAGNNLGIQPTMVATEGARLRRQSD